jgi:hypothetical protein
MAMFPSNPSQHLSPLIYNISVTWFPTGGYLETVTPHHFLEMIQEP